jgi:hypothetical protein
MNVIAKANLPDRRASKFNFLAILSCRRPWVLIALSLSGFFVAVTWAALAPINTFDADIAFEYCDAVIKPDSLRREYEDGKSPSQSELKIAELLFNWLFPTSFGVRPATEASKNRLMPQTANASSPSEYALSSATPFLPFVGNQTVLAGGLRSADGKRLSDVALRRQVDCSLALDILQPGMTTPSAGVLSRATQSSRPGPGRMNASMNVRSKCAPPRVDKKTESLEAIR